MFSKRHWKILSLGCISCLLTVGFSVVAGWRHAQPSNAGEVAIVQSEQSSQHASPTPTSSVAGLLSLLPTLEQPGSGAVGNPAIATEPVEAPSKAVMPKTVAPKTVAPKTAPPIQSFPVEPVQAVDLWQSEPLPPEPLPPVYDLELEQQKIQQQKARSKYGHLPYAEANRNHLTVAGYYGSRSERLHVDAAAAYQQMVQAARRDGVGIIPVSGFRDTRVQADLFTAQTHRQGSPERAARISAPPGHSEHHTGYAIDLGDEGMAHTDLEVAFEQTPAFRWLAQNAGSYGFELSFPPGNAQNVMYEPWHWRFVGSLHAQKTFALAR